MFKFSRTTNFFYAIALFTEFPSDCVDVSLEDHRRIMLEISEGRILTSDDSGRPITISNQVSQTDLLNQVKEDVRLRRVRMLDAVTGIGFEAFMSGDEALAKEACGIRSSLLDITDDPALNAAQTYEEMRAAGVAAYRRIAAGASPEFAATFKEFTGA